MACRRYERAPHRNGSRICILSIVGTDFNSQGLNVEPESEATQLHDVKLAYICVRGAAHLKAIYTRYSHVKEVAPNYGTWSNTGRQLTDGQLAFGTQRLRNV